VRPYSLPLKPGTYASGTSSIERKTPSATARPTSRPVMDLVMD
jgi:hypothetical protein